VEQVKTGFDHVYIALLRPLQRRWHYAFYGLPEVTRAYGKSFSALPKNFNNERNDSL